MHLNPAEEVILSPPGEVSVCPGEDPGPLVFMCTTNRSFIEWNVTLVLESGERISRRRLVTSGIQVSAPLVVNGISFNITVQGSITGSWLLTSTLTAPEPISDLNGTEVSCTTIDRSLDDAVTASTTIHVSNGGKFVSINICTDYSLLIPSPIYNQHHRKLRISLLVYTK